MNSDVCLEHVKIFRVLSREFDLRVTWRPDFVEWGPIDFPRPHSQQASVHERLWAVLSACFCIIYKLFKGEVSEAVYC
jgi:hypothetical protein